MLIALTAIILLTSTNEAAAQSDAFAVTHSANDKKIITNAFKKLPRLVRDYIMARSEVTSINFNGRFVASDGDLHYFLAIPDSLFEKANMTIEAVETRQEKQGIREKRKRGETVHIPKDDKYHTSSTDKYNPADKGIQFWSKNAIVLRSTMQKELHIIEDLNQKSNFEDASSPRLNPDGVSDCVQEALATIEPTQIRDYLNNKLMGYSMPNVHQAYPIYSTADGAYSVYHEKRLAYYKSQDQWKLLMKVGEDYPYILWQAKEKLIENLLKRNKIKRDASNLKSDKLNAAIKVFGELTAQQRETFFAVHLLGFRDKETYIGTSSEEAQTISINRYEWVDLKEHWDIAALIIIMKYEETIQELFELNMPKKKSKKKSKK